jgi:hypothetical protein
LAFHWRREESEGDPRGKWKIIYPAFSSPALSG